MGSRTQKATATNDFASEFSYEKETPEKVSNTGSMEIHNNIIARTLQHSRHN
ncbi:hypothetical protein AVEN_83892-1, partial [Araneus ventricosus]